MSDVAKWALLITGILIVIGLILNLAVFDYINPIVFNEAIATIINYCADGFKFGRGIINNLLSPWARKSLTGLMIWLIAKPTLTWSIKLSISAYHYIFK